MALGKSGQAIYLILGGAILLVFVVGLLCGGWLFSRWQQPAGVTTSVTLATVTPGGSPSAGMAKQGGEKLSARSAEKTMKARHFI